MASGNNKKLGIALVGLGKYSEGQLAPALQETKHCYLAGLVTGSSGKAAVWKNKYGIDDRNIYNYENLDSIRYNREIDILYIVLPNSMHAEYVVKAAAAGKHVICEKPMATTLADCDRMIRACKEAGVMLSIGYRLHFEPYNQEMMRLGQQKVFGKIKTLYSDHGMKDTSGWRLNKQLAGGGPLMDLGIYCVQGVRYTTGAEPVAIRAQEGPKLDTEKFREVEETMSWQMEMSDGSVAICKTSNSTEMDSLRAEAVSGWFELKPGFEYGGLKGSTSQGEMKFPQINQQARQMDDFALAIKDKRPSPVPGEMGRQDVRILLAIYEAMQTGIRVELR